MISGSNADFGKISFTGTLRPSQLDSSIIIKEQLFKNEKNLLIVAPPGSGKTVLGLYVWSNLVRLPTLVLSPNSAIQAQWIARANELFELDGRESNIGTNAATNGLLTSLTYQSITLPKRNDVNLNQDSKELWIQKLIFDDEADNEETAKLWIEDLERNNNKYYEKRLSYYRKQVRDNLTSHGNSLGVLHESAKQNLEYLSKSGIGMIILDECHHLLGHWGRVLSDIREYLGNPIVLGLTATPPLSEKVNIGHYDRYTKFFGGVDYEVPVPALVRDSNLAPYQDLAYFVRPNTEELTYIANVDNEFDKLITDTIEGFPGDTDRLPGLNNWLIMILSNLQLPGGQAKNWKSFIKRDENLANMARIHLLHQCIPLPNNIPNIEQRLTDINYKKTDVLVPLLDRYVRHGLLRSRNSEDHKLAELIKQKLRMLGQQITETGHRACASPVGRIMAYTNAKYEALRDILTTEMETLGEGIRAVIITDFEKSSATALVEGVLDDDAGGAIAAFRALLGGSTDDLDPVLMTGSTVLVDDDLFQKIMPRFNQWVLEKNLNIKFYDNEKQGYHEIIGKGSQWQPRYYTEMITELFQEGVTKCLIGTRGLLGEGWDASRINVLIDLTTVTTSMSINQLRGRSFRLDKHDPQKVSNNWDIICLAEEFSKGFDDYDRFKRKHARLFGVCDDGAIEKGVGHVHAAFTEVRPEGISETMSLFNDEMLARSRNRKRTRDLWKIGEPFNASPKEAIELKMKDGFSDGFPTSLTIGNAQWNDESLALAIADAVARALREIGILRYDTKVTGGDRGGGWMRTYLENSNEEESKIFAEAMREVLAPLDNPRYIISREIKTINHTWLSKILPDVLGKYFMKSRKELFMYHMIPRYLSQKKEDALIFLNHWNWAVSPGGITYCHTESGKKKVKFAIDKNLSPNGDFHNKSIFI
jgi:superfamily II DNA or RNA helicase